MNPFFARATEGTLRPRFSALLSYLVLFACVSMVQGSVPAPATRAELATRGEWSGQLFRSKAHSRKVQQQGGDTSAACQLKVVEPQDAEDPEVLAAPRGHSATMFARDGAICSLPDEPRCAGGQTYAPQFLVAAVLATGPPFLARAPEGALRLFARAPESALRPLRSRA